MKDASVDMETEATDKKSGKQEKIDLGIEGMHCASCVARVEKGLSGVKGVDKASVNLATESAAVTFDPSQVTVKVLSDKVKVLGYDVRGKHDVLPIEGMSCASCVLKVENALKALPGVIDASANFGTEQVTVDYVIEPGSATPDRDFVAENMTGTLTFVRDGGTELGIPFVTIDNDKYDGARRAIVRITNPVDVELGALIWVRTVDMK